MIDALENLSPDDIVGTLPTATRRLVRDLLARGSDPLEVARELAAASREDLVPKGGGLWTEDILGAVVAEIRTLICTDDARYAPLRAVLAGGPQPAVAALVYVIASAIAEQLHVAVGHLVPLVALSLAAMVETGVVRWCADPPASLARQ